MYIELLWIWFLVFCFCLFVYLFFGFFFAFKIEGMMEVEMGLRERWVSWVNWLFQPVFPSLSLIVLPFLDTTGEDAPSSTVTGFAKMG